MFGGVKITLILCATMVVCCVLFISYNEYTNRYTLLTSSDNSLYIFDKKSTVLNKCDSKSCSILETKLPMQNRTNFDTPFQLSRMFDTNLPMTREVSEKISEAKAQNEPALPETRSVEATPAEDTTPSIGQGNAKTYEKLSKKNEAAKEPADVKNVSDEASSQKSTDSQKSKNTAESADDEFVE